MQVGQKFKHKPLDLTQPSMRLLTLLGRDRQGTINCYIDDYAFPVKRKPPVYTAISYEWGDPKAAMHQIKINGHSFDIRNNLYSFLETLLRVRPSVVSEDEDFWIDAICINQEDGVEKNHQVALMKTIYEQASKTLIWLGPATRRSDEVFEVAERSIACTRDRSSSAPDFKFTDALAQRCDFLSSMPPAMQGVVHSFESALAELCTLSYWTRLWVVQEILLSPNALVMCGRQTMPWDAWVMILSLHLERNPKYSKTLAKVLRPSLEQRSHGVAKGNREMMSSTDLIEPAADSTIDGLATKLCDQWLRRRHSHARNPSRPWESLKQASNLVELIIVFAQSECQDRHDRVYALLGLSTKSIDVDYRYSMEQLSVLVLSLVSGEKSLDAMVTLCRRLDVEPLNLLHWIDEQRSGPFISSASTVSAALEILETPQFRVSVRQSAYDHGARPKVFLCSCHRCELVRSACNAYNPPYPPYRETIRSVQDSWLVLEAERNAVEGHLQSTGFIFTYGNRTTCDRSASMKYFATFLSTKSVKEHQPGLQSLFDYDSMDWFIFNDPQMADFTHSNNAESEATTAMFELSTAQILNVMAHQQKPHHAGPRTQSVPRLEHAWNLATMSPAMRDDLEDLDMALLQRREAIVKSLGR